MNENGSCELEKAFIMLIQGRKVAWRVIFAGEIPKIEYSGVMIGILERQNYFEVRFNN